MERSATSMYLRAIVWVIGLTLVAIVLVFAIKPDTTTGLVVTMIAGFSGQYILTLFKGLQTSAAVAEVKASVQENTNITMATQERGEARADEVKAEVQSVKQMVKEKS